MDGHNTDALFLGGHTQGRNIGRPSGWRYKYRGRSKSPGKSLRKCWKCGKTGHYRKYCKSKTGLEIWIAEDIQVGYVFNVFEGAIN